MLPFLARRTFSAVITLLLLATLTFFLLRLAPGGPFDAEVAWPPEIQAHLLARYELDLPLCTQYLHWLRDLAHGDLRESFQYLSEPVSRIIAESLPVSVALGGVSLVLAVLIGVALGGWAAWRRGSWVDRVAVAFAVAGGSMPPYLVASILILVFALWLRWLPPALWDEPGAMILPVLTLAWRPLAMIIRLSRASLLEALRTDYVRAAYGRGASEARVLFKHALRNSLLPVLALLGPLAAHLITGSFLVETAFQLPGLGKHFVTAVLNRDYPLVLGVTLVYGAVLLAGNLLVDLLSAWADPRLRESRAETA